MQRGLASVVHDRNDIHQTRDLAMKTRRRPDEDSREHKQPEAEKGKYKTATHKARSLCLVFSRMHRGATFFFPLPSGTTRAGRKEKEQGLCRRERKQLFDLQGHQAPLEHLPWDTLAWVDPGWTEPWLTWCESEQDMVKRCHDGPSTQESSVGRPGDRAALS